MNPINSIGSSKDFPDINDVHADASPANVDPFKFSHGLTSVDQPSNYFLVHVLLALLVVASIFALTFWAIVRDEQEDKLIASRLRCRVRDANRHHQSKNDEHRPGSTQTTSNVVNTGRRQWRISQLRLLRIRLQYILITTYITVNIIFSLAVPQQDLPARIAAIRGRCGTLAAFNLIFTVLFALRNNPLLWVLRLSYDTFNLFHRWTARMVVMQTTLHVIAFAWNTYQVTFNGQSGLKNIIWVLGQSASFRWGVVAFLAFLFLLLHSIQLLRHASYDLFVSLHRIGIIVAITGVYWHLRLHGHRQLIWIYGIIILLVLEPVVRAIRVSTWNISWKPRAFTQVIMEALPGEATRVEFKLPRSWNVQPGTHVHVYVPSLSLWTSHPFSVAWSQASQDVEMKPEKLPLHTNDIAPESGHSTISCVIRARAGMTRRLHDAACRQNNVRQSTLWAIIEGPYGSRHSLDSYSTAILFAAGVGITHQLLYVRHLLEGYSEGTVASRRIVLAWSITELDCFQWARPYLDEMAAMPYFDDVIRIKVYITRCTANSIEVIDFSSQMPGYVETTLGRCIPQDIVDNEMYPRSGSMVVTTCGPTVFNDAVRDAVRSRMDTVDVDFLEESFSY